MTDITPETRAAERASLRTGMDELGLRPGEAQLDQLQKLLDELQHWNEAYNLTAIRERPAMVTQHLLDSLSVDAFVRGPRVADLGTGAGFPGLPLAIMHPEWSVVLIDSNAKKTRFVAHAARALGLGNAHALHARAEQAGDQAPFDTVVARAVAELGQLARWARPLCGPGSRLVAMKGRPSAAELADLPPGWRILENRAVHVPGLAAERHVVTLQP